MNGFCTHLFLVEIIKLFIIENLGAVCEDSSDHIVTSDNHPTKQSILFLTMSEIIFGCKMEGHKMRATREKPLKEASPGVIDTPSDALY